MKKFKIIGLICIMALLATFFVACGTSYNPTEQIDFSKLQVKEDLDAYTLYKEIEDTYHNDKGYHRQDFFNFTANDTLVTQQSIFESYRDGDKYFHRNVVLGDGIQTRHDFDSIYFDGTTAYFAGVDNGKKVHKNKEKDDPFKKDFYVVEDYSTFETLESYNEKQDIDNEIDLEKEFKHNFQHITTYNTDKKENLATDTDNKVYVLDNDTLVFRITLDCSDTAMKNIHPDARQEFIHNTGAIPDTFKMLENTTIQITCKMIDGKYKLTSWLRTEHYTGKKEGLGISITCFQQSYCTIEYDNYTITNDVLITKLA